MISVVVLCLSLLTVPQGSFAQFFMADRLPSPVVKGGSVTFQLKADNAKTVEIVGDFLPDRNEYGVNGHALMHKDSDGLWRLTVDSLKPDFYYYHFLVDGVWVLDRGTLRLTRNFVDYESYFIVPGKESADYEECPDHKGSLVSVWYDSPEYGATRHMNVYLPYGYSADKRYPVLYLQHGGGDDEETWLDMGRTRQIMDHLIRDGRAVPMIVVIPNTMPDEAASQDVLPLLKDKKGVFGRPVGSDGFLSGGDYVNDLTHNIVPYVESHFSVIKDKDHRALVGLSMGGSYTLYAIEHHPDLFGYIGIMGSGFFNEGDVDRGLAPVKKSGYRLFWVGVGEKDIAQPSAQKLIKGLKRNNMPFESFDPGSGHNWSSWRKDLKAIAPKLFK